MAPFAYILTNLIPYLLQYAGADYLGEVVPSVRLLAEKDHEVAYSSTHISLPALPPLFRVATILLLISCYSAAILLFLLLFCCYSVAILLLAAG